MNILLGLGIFIAAFIVGIGVQYFTDKKKLEAVQEYNGTIEVANEQLALENENLTHYKHSLEQDIKSLQFNEQQYIGKLKGLDASLKEAEASAKGAADRFYEQSMQLAQERLERSLADESAKYQTSIQQFQDEMAQIKQEYMADYQLTIDETTKQRTFLRKELQTLQSSVEAAVAAAKRAEEMVNQQNFYRIQLNEIDIDEIEKLRSVEPYLRDKEPLNKVIWKVYYEKPTNDLIGRVIGSGTHTGIYKITNIDSQKCYVGQAANLADRWKQHIKRGVGADAPTRNKLYPAMRELGPENFTFEVIEECDRSLLDSREDYWQEYFKAKEFGYSIK